MIIVVLLVVFRMRKGKELKVPYYASAAATYNNHVTIRDIIPNTGNSSFMVAIYI